MRVLSAGLLALALTGGVATAGIQIHHRWDCRDVSLKIVGKTRAARTVCYPCPLAPPDGMPDVVYQLWEQEVCAPIA